MSGSGHADAASALKALLPATPAPVPCARDRQRGRKLKLFVYTLSWGYAGQIVEYVENRARSLLGVKCSYLREDTCPNTGFSHLENLRSHCTDVPLMYKLLQAVTIEPDPEKADVFLVPFLMGCNAMLGWGHGMQRVNSREHHAFFGNFPAFARKELPHFAKWPHRHLFLFPLDSMFAPKWLLPSMVAHTGSGYTTAGLDVTVPYLVSLPPAPADAWSAPRGRLVFLMASPSRNLVRKELAAQLRVAVTRMRADPRRAPNVELYETDPSKENAMPLSAAETMARMRSTVFCIAPTGDSDGFTQRFYYILAAGCIPVRVDTYYANFSFGRVAWPSKQTVQWHKAAVLLPPHVLKRMHRTQAPTPDFTPSATAPPPLLLILCSPPPCCGQVMASYRPSSTSPRAVSPPCSDIFARSPRRRHSSTTAAAAPTHSLPSSTSCYTSRAHACRDMTSSMPLAAAVVARRGGAGRSGSRLTALRCVMRCPTGCRDIRRQACSVGCAAADRTHMQYMPLQPNNLLRERQ